METVNLFGAARSRLAQAAVLVLGEERFSTQELAQKLGVSIPTAIDLTRSLARLKLAAECGVFGSTGGRKARAYAPVPAARQAIGVDITAGHVSLVTADLAGRVTQTRRHALPFARTPAYFEALARMVNELCADAGLPLAQALGVGLSIPGIVSEGEDLVLRSHALGIEGLRVREFERCLGAPCRMLNDANAGCIAEVRQNEALRDAVYLSLSNSVGSAVLIGRRLYLGRNMRSGEVGHTTLVPGGLPCYCGKRGCADAYCRAGRLSEAADGSLRAFFELLHAGDAGAQKLWSTYLDDLAVVVNNLRMMFDCDIILGGYVGRYIGAELPELRRRAARLNTFETNADFLHACTYQNEAAALGAALCWVEDYLSAL